MAYVADRSASSSQQPVRQGPALTQQKASRASGLEIGARPGAGRLQQGDGRAVIGPVNTKTQFERPMIAQSERSTDDAARARAVQIVVRSLYRNTSRWHVLTGIA